MKLFGGLPVASYLAKSAEVTVCPSPWARAERNWPKIGTWGWGGGWIAALAGATAPASAATTPKAVAQPLYDQRALSTSGPIVDRPGAWRAGCCDHDQNPRTRPPDLVQPTSEPLRLAVALQERLFHAPKSRTASPNAQRTWLAAEGAQEHGGRARHRLEHLARLVQACAQLLVTGLDRQHRVLQLGDPSVRVGQRRRHHLDELLDSLRARPRRRRFNGAPAKPDPLGELGVA